jgi:hypothetical protein
MKCFLLPDPGTMDPLTILLAGLLFIAAMLFVLTATKRDREVSRRINKIQGPMSLPVFGTDLPLLFVKRRGE